ncbi:MAG: YggS family pyridoxal phosphate-dependent enzyme [Leucobacter sp.]
MADVTPDESELGDRIAAVRSRVEEVCASVGRSSEELTLIVVTKFHQASLVRQLVRLGVTDVGENRHQEAQEKARELTDLDVNWHFIGQLQTKKAKQAAQYASAIHSIDRARLVDSLASIDHTIDAFVQINLTDDPGRGGADPRLIETLTEQILETETLRLRGVMAVAPLEEPAAAAFERLAGYSLRVRALAPDATSISAGMTHDYAEAIAAGATHLRIGSAITGNRPEAR